MRRRGPWLLLPTLLLLLFPQLLLLLHAPPPCVDAAAAAAAALGPELDLIEALGNGSYAGLEPARGMHRWSPAVRLSASRTRQVALPAEAARHAARLLLSPASDVTLMATVRQEPRNVGTVLSLCRDGGGFVELQSSGRRDELRLHYVAGGGRQMVETFPYRLADGAWHQVAVAISGPSVQLFVDCSRVYSRLLRQPPKTVADDEQQQDSGKPWQLWLGQRNARHFHFRGELQDVRIVAQPQAVLLQCPQLDAQCPTCGQFQELREAVVRLEGYVSKLTQRLAEAEQRIASVEECECQRNCRVNDTVRPDGAVWKQDCDICTCTRGKVECHPISCPAPPCKHPVLQPGECCPTCLKRCFLKQVLYDHGEQVTQKCVQCNCSDGQMTCRRIDQKTCPALTCPESQRFSVPGECCMFCPGVDYCARGHDCDQHASCVNLQTKYACQCRPGYAGSGRVCEDVDECLKEGGFDGHHCQASSTRCANTPGSYRCDCLPGFSRVDAFSCVEVDECASGQHDCHRLARCVNTPGSYECRCPAGYRGDGRRQCAPVCSRGCLNGGRCAAPETCACRRGFAGARCERDLDECAEGVHGCDEERSRCVNMPGWFYCECREGYAPTAADGSCEDVDECALATHTCHSTATCVNERGSFSCVCADNSSCSLKCDHRGVERTDGERWPGPDPCTRCVCRAGVARCDRAPCRCDSPRVDLRCCPECDRAGSCEHPDEPGVRLASGQRWLHNCQQCECLRGELDCWPVECPPLRCAAHSLRPGECCPRCEDDDHEECAGAAANSSGHRGCMHMGRTYRAGELVPLDPCASCKCADGHLCCLYSADCLGRDGPSVSQLRVPGPPTHHLP